MREIEFRRDLRRRFKGWSEVYEPGIGGGTGIPDVQFMVEGILFPVELKIGKVVGEKGLSFDLRPAQRVWHNNFFSAGGVSVVAVCHNYVGMKYNTFLIPGFIAAAWPFYRDKKYAQDTVFRITYEEDFTKAFTAIMKEYDGLELKKEGVRQ